MSRSGPGQTIVAAAEIDQRVPSADARALDATDEDRVVALEVHVDGRALEVGERVVEERQAQRAQRERHALERVLDLGRGEPARDAFLVMTEYVDREPLARDQGRIALRLVVDADEDERRLERDRREGARGETGRPAVAVAHGDDRHARGEMAQRMAEFVRGDHSLFVAGPLRAFKVSRLD